MSSPIEGSSSVSDSPEASTIYRTFKSVNEMREDPITIALHWPLNEYAFSCSPISLSDDFEVQLFTCCSMTGEKGARGNYDYQFEAVTGARGNYGYPCEATTGARGNYDYPCEAVTGARGNYDYPCEAVTGAIGNYDYPCEAVTGASGSYGYPCEAKTGARRNYDYPCEAKTGAKGNYDYPCEATTGANGNCDYLVFGLRKPQTETSSICWGPTEYVPPEYGERIQSPKTHILNKRQDEG
jgi:hypothetical protein